MNLLNANTTPPGYPLTEDDLRRAFPNTTFPRNPDEATVASFGWHRVTATPRPADTRIERYEDTAELADGSWRQVWVARAATAGEQAEWDAAHQPDSDWLGFAGWLFRFPPMAEAMNSARVSTSDQGEPATTALPAAMQEARLNQNYPAWAATWGQFLLASGMGIETLAQIVDKAMACHLPADFITALQPQLPGGEG
jgi:hypothetical protein